MLERVVRKIRRITPSAVPFDPSCFDDPVALRTSWDPAKGGGASFRTHRLVDEGNGRMAFKATRGALAFYGIFLAVGLAGLGAFAFRVVPASGSGGTLSMVLPLLAASAFAAAGGGLLWTGAAPIVFDTRRGEFWRGRVAPSEVADPSRLKAWADLGRIHALQIVSEHCRGNDSSYYSYELNVVLEDGSRLNVIDHGDLDELRADARALSGLLGKPLWDATVGMSGEVGTK